MIYCNLKMKNNDAGQNKELRKLAEEQLLRLNKDFDELTLQNAKQIFHELQVHQIELEMQNEELRKTQLELDDAREKYFGLYNLAPAGYLTISEKGLITEANLTAANLFGVTKNQLLRQPVSRFIMKEDQDIYYLKSKQLFETEKKQQFDIRMTQKKGLVFWAEFACVAVRANDGSLFCNTIIKNITERKQADEALKASEIRYRMLFETAKDGILILDANNGDILDVNPFMAEMLGYRDKDIPGKKFWELGLFKDKHIAKLSFDTLKVNPYNRFEDLTLQAKDGHKKFVDFISNAYQIGQKQVIHCNLRDVTERKQALDEIRKYREHLEELVKNRTAELVEKNALLKKEILKRKQANETIQQLASIVTYSNDAIIGETPEGIITSWNKGAEKLFGYTAKEILGRSVSFLVPPNYADEVSMLLEKISQGMQVKEHETMHAHKDGHLVSISITISPVKNSAGRIIGASIIAHDITKRKLAEEALTRERILMRTLIDSAVDQIYVKDTMCRFILANSNIAYFYGMKKPDEMIGKTDFDILPNEQAEKCYKEEQDILHSGKPLINKEETGNYLNGEKCWFSITKIPLYNSENVVTGLVGINRDITIIKQAEENMQKAMKAAEEANQAKSEFLANMSHEIRTPMNSIIGFSDLLYATVEDKKQRSQIDSIRNSSRNLLSIINDILDLSKIEAGKLNLEYNTVNLDNFITDIQDVFSQKLKEKEIFFGIKKEADIPENLLMDEVRLRQILFNLIGNAVKFTDKGHITLTLGYVMKMNHKIDLNIKVEDSGIGIPKEQQQMIFEAFNQQDGQNIQKYGGTGLGLPITKRLAEMMGGKITVESETGKGSIFKIFLPDIEIAGFKESAKDEKIVNPKSIIFEEAKILIADDEQSNRKLLVDLLEYSPLILYEAENGKEAFDIAVKNLPDLIIMDLRMPEMNGYEATKKLKNQESTKLIPVIAISASAKKFSPDEKIPDMFNEFLVKPINLFDLVELLKKYLNYSVIKDVTEKEGSKEWGIEINEELKMHVPEILNVLEKIFLPEYYEMLKIQSMDQIEDFGKKLVSMGEKYPFQMIIRYGNEIVTYADSFDVEKLLNKLDRFPALIEEIKSL